MKAAVERVQQRVENPHVWTGAVDEEPDDADGGGGDRHRHEDRRLDRALIAHADRENGEPKSDEQGEADVEDDPADVVDQGAAGWELAQVEEVLVVGQQLLEVMDPKVVGEAEVETSLVEGEPDRVVGRIDQEDRQHDERRQHEQHSLDAFEG